MKIHTASSLKHYKRITKELQEVSEHGYGFCIPCISCTGGGDMVDNMTSKVQGAADGVPSAVQKMNDAFGTMQKAGAAMTGTGTAIVGACMGTVTATFDTQDALG